MDRSVEEARRVLAQLRRERYYDKVRAVCCCDCHGEDEPASCGCCYSLADLIAQIVDQEMVSYGQAVGNEITKIMAKHDEKLSIEKMWAEIRARKTAR